jgi:hypothetical protein
MASSSMTRNFNDDLERRETSNEVERRITRLKTGVRVTSRRKCTGLFNSFPSSRVNDIDSLPDLFEAGLSIGTSQDHHLKAELLPELRRQLGDVDLGAVCTKENKL